MPAPRNYPGQAAEMTASLSDDAGLAGNQTALSDD